MPDFDQERRHGAAAGRLVIGLDEAGRGPWAGPVVAAAAWLDGERLPPALGSGLDDSKALNEARREALYAALEEAAAAGTARFASAVVSAAEIDRLNILQASLQAMARAAAALSLAPDVALVDGNKAPALPCLVETLVKGDARSLSIAAASIVAKVERDRLMAALAERHPGYGWERNRGYGTAEHRAALVRLGVTPEHRRSFRPVRESLSISP